MKINLICILFAFLYFLIRDENSMSQKREAREAPAFFQ